MKRSIAVLAVGLLMVAAAAPAGATAPERFEFEDGLQEVYASCDGFEVVIDLEVSVRGSLHSSGPSDPVLVREHWKLWGTIHRDDRAGPVLSEKDAWMNVYTLDEPDLVIHHGIMFNTIVPGYGPVFKLTGTMTGDWSTWPPTLVATGWNVTPYDPPPESIAVLCEYFG